MGDFHLWVSSTQRAPLEALAEIERSRSKSRADQQFAKAFVVVVRAATTTTTFLRVSRRRFKPSFVVGGFAVNWAQVGPLVARQRADKIYNRCHKFASLPHTKLARRVRIGNVAKVRKIFSHLRINKRPALMCAPKTTDERCWLCWLIISFAFSELLTKVELSSQVLNSIRLNS